MSSVAIEVVTNRLAMLRPEDLIDREIHTDLSLWESMRYKQCIIVTAVYALRAEIAKGEVQPLTWPQTDLVLIRKLGNTQHQTYDRRGVACELGKDTRIFGAVSEIITAMEALERPRFPKQDGGKAVFTCRASTLLALFIQYSRLTRKEFGPGYLMAFAAECANWLKKDNSNFNSREFLREALGQEVESTLSWTLDQLLLGKKGEDATANSEESVVTSAVA